MFTLFDKVKIKKNNIIGTIIDISEINGQKKYIVESDEKSKRDDADYDIEWPEFDCTDDDLIKI